MSGVLRITAEFVLVMVLTATVCSAIWEGFVTDTVYNCTDSVGFDALHPGDWVHGQVMIVDKVVTGRPMSEPDTIKEGWSSLGLWVVWICLAVASLCTSFVLARRPWMPAKRSAVG